MAVCEKCGKASREDEKFCTVCGSTMRNASQEEKKKRVLGSEARSRKVPIIIAGAVVVLVVGFFAISSHGSRGKGGMMQSGDGSSAPQADYASVAAENGEIRIPESSLEGGRARYFVYSSKGRTVKFFALRAQDGTVRVALDACSACYHAKLGYRQHGDAMVCNNCGMEFRSTDVGKITGGCSPIPVENRIEKKLIVVKAAELEAGAKYF